MYTSNSCVAPRGWRQLSARTSPGAPGTVAPNIKLRWNENPFSFLLCSNRWCEKVPIVIGNAPAESRLSSYYDVYIYRDQVTISIMPDYEEVQLQLQDGYPAYARYWPQRDPRGAVLYFHGIQSHCGWYEQSAARLAQEGYVVLQVDRRGSGRNSQGRGHAESADQLIADAQTARDELLKLSGLDRYHMVGVSWGGKLVAASYISDPAGVQSLTLVTPGLFPLVGVSKEVQSDIGMAMIYEPNNLFDIPLSEPKLFTSNPTWQEFFQSDPYTLWQCTAGFYLASRRMDKPIATLPGKNPVPIHLLIAGDEHIIDNDKTINFVRGLDWQNSRVTTYEHVRHSLEFEACSEKYFDDLAAFINDMSDHH